jgi:hypothetical protein
MKHEFIPYKEALALKELGFDEPCFGFYNHQGILILMNQEDELNIQVYKNSYVKLGKQYSAPLYQQAFRWFREKYVLLGFIEPANGYDDKSLFAFYICDDEQNIVDDSHSYSKDSSLHFKTYEEAELACLKKLIVICKTHNKRI